MHRSTQQGHELSVSDFTTKGSNKHEGSMVLELLI